MGLRSLLKRYNPLDPTSDFRESPAFNWTLGDVAERVGSASERTGATRALGAAAHVTGVDEVQAKVRRWLEENAPAIPAATGALFSNKEEGAGNPLQRVTGLGRSISGVGHATAGEPLAFLLNKAAGVEGGEGAWSGRNLPALKSAAAEQSNPLLRIAGKGAAFGLETATDPLTYVPTSKLSTARQLALGLAGVGDMGGRGVAQKVARNLITGAGMGAGSAAAQEVSDNPLLGLAGGLAGGVAAGVAGPRAPGLRTLWGKEAQAAPSHVDQILALMEKADTEGLPPSRAVRSGMAASSIVPGLGPKEPNRVPFNKDDVPLSDIRLDPARFQKRGLAEGQAVDPAEVEALAERFRTEGFDPELGRIEVVRDPDNPGKFIVQGGHHRYEAAKLVGRETMPVRVKGWNIADPTELAGAQVEAVTGNFRQRQNTLADKVRAVQTLAEMGFDPKQIGVQTAMRPKQVTDLTNIARMGQGVIDRITADRPNEAALASVAAEIGRGIEQYGITPEDAAGLFHRMIAPDAQGRIASARSVAETVDTFGLALRDNPMQDGFFGLVEDGGGRRGGILERIDQYNRAVEDINRQRRALVTQRNTLAKAAAGTTPERAAVVEQIIADKEAEIATLQARRDQIGAEILGDLSGRRPVAEAAPEPDLVPDQSPVQNGPDLFAEPAPPPAPTKAPAVDTYTESRLRELEREIRRASRRGETDELSLLLGESAVLKVNNGLTDQITAQEADELIGQYQPVVASWQQIIARGGRPSELEHARAKLAEAVAEVGTWEGYRAQANERTRIQAERMAQAPLPVAHDEGVWGRSAEAAPTPDLAPPPPVQSGPDLFGETAVPETTPETNSVQQTISELAPPEMNRETTPALDRFYHGTSQTFETFDPGRADYGALYGDGVYFTSDPRVAGGVVDEAGVVQRRGYAQNRGGKGAPGPEDAPQVRVAGLPRDLNLFDAERPVSEADVAAMIDALHERAMASPQYDPLLDPSEELAFLVDDTEGWTNHNLYRALERVFGEDRGAVNEFLASLGFDGIRYEGGKRVPLKDEAGAPITHNVVVVFPDAMAKVQEGVSVAPPPSPTKPGTLGAAARGETPLLDETDLLTEDGRIATDPDTVDLTVTGADTVAAAEPPDLPASLRSRLPEAPGDIIPPAAPTPVGASVRPELLAKPLGELQRLRRETQTQLGRARQLERGDLRAYLKELDAAIAAHPDAGSPIPATTGGTSGPLAGATGAGSSSGTASVAGGAGGVGGAGPVSAPPAGGVPGGPAVPGVPPPSGGSPPPVASGAGGPGGRVPPVDPTAGIRDTTPQNFRQSLNAALNEAIVPSRNHPEPTAHLLWRKGTVQTFQVLGEMAKPVADAAQERLLAGAVPKPDGYLVRRMAEATAAKQAAVVERLKQLQQSGLDIVNNPQDYQLSTDAETALAEIRGLFDDQFDREVRAGAAPSVKRDNYLPGVYQEGVAPKGKVSPGERMALWAKQSQQYEKTYDNYVDAVMGGREPATDSLGDLLWYRIAHGGTAIGNREVYDAARQPGIVVPAGSRLGQEANYKVTTFDKLRQMFPTIDEGELLTWLRDLEAGQMTPEQVKTRVKAGMGVRSAPLAMRNDWFRALDNETRASAILTNPVGSKVDTGLDFARSMALSGDLFQMGTTLIRGAMLTFSTVGPRQGVPILYHALLGALGGKRYGEWLYSPERLRWARDIDVAAKGAENEILGHVYGAGGYERMFDALGAAAGKTPVAGPLLARVVDLPASMERAQFERMVPMAKTAFANGIYQMVAKVKGLDPTAYDNAELMQAVGRYVQNYFSGPSRTALGLSKDRAVVERWLLLAPTYFRGQMASLVGYPLGLNRRGLLNEEEGRAMQARPQTRPQEALAPAEWGAPVTGTTRNPATGVEGLLGRKFWVQGATLAFAANIGAALFVQAATGNLTRERAEALLNPDSPENIVNPTSKYFGTIPLPDGTRVSTMGTFRTLARAMFMPAAEARDSAYENARKGAYEAILKDSLLAFMEATGKEVPQYLWERKSIAAGLAADWADNADWKGGAIRDESAPFPVQLVQFGEYAGKGTLPQSIGSFFGQRAEDDDPSVKAGALKALGSFVGVPITPGPDHPKEIVEAARRFLLDQGVAPGLDPVAQYRRGEGLEQTARRLYESRNPQFADYLMEKRVDPASRPAKPVGAAAARQFRVTQAELKTERTERLRALDVQMKAGTLKGPDYRALREEIRTDYIKRLQGAGQAWLGTTDIDTANQIASQTRGFSDEGHSPLDTAMDLYESLAPADSSREAVEAYLLARKDLLRPGGGLDQRFGPGMGAKVRDTLLELAPTPSERRYLEAQELMGQYAELSPYAAIPDPARARAANRVIARARDRQKAGIAVNTLHGVMLDKEATKQQKNDAYIALSVRATNPKRRSFWQANPRVWEFYSDLPQQEIETELQSA